MAQLVLQPADRPLGLELQADPVHVVALEREHIVELFFAAPVGELGAVQEHHAAGVTAGPLLRTGAHAAEDRLATHVAGQELPDVADGEDIRVDDDRTAFVAHEFRRHEAQQGKRLQIFISPWPFDPVPLKKLAFLGL
jgi:hypothetical protein